jgi:hypothetical protein
MRFAGSLGCSGHERAGTADGQPDWALMREPGVLSTRYCAPGN